MFCEEGVKAQLPNEASELGLTKPIIVLEFPSAEKETRVERGYKQWVMIMDSCVLCGTRRVLHGMVPFVLIKFCYVSAVPHPHFSDGRSGGPESYLTYPELQNKEV